MSHVEPEATPTAAYCVSCGKSLTTGEMFTVKGSVYCESCLAESIRKGSVPPRLEAETVGGTNPGAAFALGFIPGVGALYNAEWVKAAAHILIFGLLVTIAQNSGPAEPLFGLMTAGFVFYMAFDAYYTAKKRRMGLKGVHLETPIDRLQQQFGEVPDKQLWGGGMLIVLGSLFLMDTLGILRFSAIGRLWPLFLIAIGIRMIQRRNFKGGGV